MTLYLGVALVVAAILLFIMQPLVKGLHASLERDEGELTETEARKRVALLALRDVEYDFLAGKLDENDYRRNSPRFTALYRRRSSVEREFGRLKNEWALSPLRGVERVKLHADLTILAKLACALSRARAVPLAA